MSDEDIVEVDDTADVGEEMDSDVDVSVDESVAAGQSPEASQQPQQDVWGAFKQLPQFQGADDRAIASRLYEALQREQSATHALQQYQSTIPVVSEYLQKKELFDAWLQQQHAERTGYPPAQQQKQAEPEESWWNPPKIRDAYKQYLSKDEQGRDVIDPSAPLDARHALTEYLQHRAEFAKKFLDNPQEALGPMVERVAQQRAESIVSQQIGQMKEEAYVSSLEQQNADWLYDRSGNVSPEGLAVQKYIQDARQLGIQGAQARWDYATRMVERDLLVANLQMQHQQQFQQPPAPQQMQPAPSPADTKAQQNMEYLRQQAMRTASQRPAASTDARVPKKPMTFAEKLAANLQDAGLASY
jgi:hypothetical protein